MSCYMLIKGKRLKQKKSMNCARRHLVFIHQFQRPLQQQQQQQQQQTSFKHDNSASKLIRNSEQERTCLFTEGKKQIRSKRTRQGR